MEVVTFAAGPPLPLIKVRGSGGMSGICSKQHVSGRADPESVPEA